MTIKSNDGGFDKFSYYLQLDWQITNQEVLMCFWAIIFRQNSEESFFINFIDLKIFYIDK